MTAASVISPPPQGEQWSIAVQGPAVAVWRRQADVPLIILSSDTYFMLPV